MGITNRQFQGFVRLTLAALERAFEQPTDNQQIKELIEAFQAIVENI